MLLLSIVTTNILIVDTLRFILDEKLASLKAEIAELTLFIDNASKKYDEVLKTLSEQEAVNKTIAKENEFLKSTVKARNENYNLPVMIWSNTHDVDVWRFKGFLSPIKKTPTRSL